jgi:hypothetical protein
VVIKEINYMKPDDDTKTTNTDDDFLDTWRKDVKGYGSAEEEDSMVTAVNEYNKQQEEKK